MNKEFVPYKIALDLKELGFDEPCFGRYYYRESYPMLNPKSEETEVVFEFGQYIKQTEVTIVAPTFSQAFRWFEEKHGMYVEWLIDMWLDDEKVSDEMICYTTFIWQIGKPKPKPWDEIGHGSWYSMAISSINDMINTLKYDNKEEDNKVDLIDKEIHFIEQKRRLIQMMQDDENDGLYDIN